MMTTNTTDPEPLADAASLKERAPDAIKPTSRQVELGFMFNHSLLSETSRQVLSTATAAYAVADLLVEKGLIREDELKARRDAVEAILLKQTEDNALGLFLNEECDDKYALAELPQINCADRMHLCHAACCLLRVPLSRQDVEEGIVRWDLGRPYWNLRDATGYCIHNDPEKRCCNIYEARPGPCRSYDCRQDKRIWLDFETMIVNPNLAKSIAGSRE